MEDGTQVQPAGVYGTPEQIVALYTNLALVQGELEGARKDKTNPAFKSSYADLTSVWDACRKPLTAHGFSVVQLPQFIPGDVVPLAGVRTMLCHKDGGSIECSLYLPCGGTPQQVGSALTYARRYTLAAVVGVCAEDDDGNAAQDGAERAIERAAARPVARPANGAPPTAATPAPKTEQEKLAAAGRRLYAVMNARNVPKDASHSIATAALKRQVESIADLDAKERHAVADWLAQASDDVLAPILDAGPVEVDVFA